MLGIVSHHVGRPGAGSEGACRDMERIAVLCPKATLHLNQGEGFQQRQSSSQSTRSVEGKQRH